MHRITLTTPATAEYALLDSGDQQKLERFGAVVLARPDPQALWKQTLPAGEWEKAAGRFVRTGKEGEWQTKPDFPAEWPVTLGGLQFLLRPTSFKHTGIFPEQLPNWEWAQNVIKEALGSGGQKSGFAKQRGAGPSPDGETFGKQNPARTSVSVLNLFGYTGGATLAAAKAGAEVTHLDASKVAVSWAKENAVASGLGEAPIRWIVDDALVFVRREIARGKKYDAIIMDPPAFGHGPKRELWKIEEDLVELFSLCQQLLTDEPLFVLVNGYAAGYSPLAFAYNLEAFCTKYGGEIEYGDLTIAQEGSERVLPCGIFARWKK